MRAEKWIGRGLALAALITLGVALPAGAQQAAQLPAQPPAAATPSSGLKVAVIDGNRVLAESNIGIQVQQEAQAAAAQWDTQIRAKQTQIDSLVAQGQEQRLTLTEAALARIAAQVEQLQVDLERLRDDATRAMTLMSEEAQTRINDVLIPAVEVLANEAGYELILDTRIQGILFFADVIDATERYIAIVNGGNPPVPQQNQ